MSTIFRVRIRISTVDLDDNFPGSGGSGSVFRIPDPDVNFLILIRQLVLASIEHISKFEAWHHNQKMDLHGTQILLKIVNVFAPLDSGYI
jgi:hypothetical protein